MAVSVFVCVCEWGVAGRTRSVSALQDGAGLPERQATALAEKSQAAGLLLGGALRRLRGVLLLLSGSLSGGGFLAAARLFLGGLLPGVVASGVLLLGGSFCFLKKIEKNINKKTNWRAEAPPHPYLSSRWRRPGAGVAWPAVD